MIPEKQIERRLVSWLRARAIEVVKMALQHDAGWPDLQILLPGGRTLWMELKRNGGVVSPLQRSKMDWLHRDGRDVVVCYSFEEAIDQVTRRLQ